MADCPYTKVAIMQLFYELKEKFPDIPDQIMSDLMEQTLFNRQECEKKLQNQQGKFQTHSYPADIVLKITEGKERPKFLPIASASNLPHVMGDLRRPTHPTGAEEENMSRMGGNSKSLTCAAGHSTNGYEAISNCNQSDLSDDDLKSCIRKGNLNSSYDSLQVLQAGGSHSAPTTPSFQNGDLSEASIRKHRSSLNVDRPPLSPCSAESKRPSTSVMLTLRPPSTEHQQPPINITTTGAQLTYATSSYDAKQGYQNQLQISINEDGNPTLTAARLRTNYSIPNCHNSTSTFSIDEVVSRVLPSFDKALSSTLELRISEQKERKKKLEMELIHSREKLFKLQQEILVMEKDLEVRRRKAPSKSENVLRLQQEVSDLRNECRRLYIETESQEQPAAFPTMVGNDTGSWMCSMCTFMNHPMLPRCEQCEMVQVNVPNCVSNIPKLPTASIHTQN